MLGLSGELPESVDPVAAGPMVAAVRESGRLRPARQPRDRLRPGRGHRAAPAQAAAVPPQRDAVRGLRRRRRAARAADLLLGRRRLRARRGRGRRSRRSCADATPVPYPFSTGAELLAHTSSDRAADQRRDAGQRAGPPAAPSAISAGLLGIWAVMQECVERGCAADGRAARRAARSGAGPRALRETLQRTTRHRQTRCTRWSGSPCTRWPSTRRTPPAAGWSPRRPTARPGSSRRCCTTTRGSCPAPTTTAWSGSC